MVSDCLGRAPIGCLLAEEGEANGDGTFQVQRRHVRYNVFLRGQGDRRSLEEGGGGMAEDPKVRRSVREGGKPMETNPQTKSDYEIAREPRGRLLAWQKTSSWTEWPGPVAFERQCRRINLTKLNREENGID